MKITKLLKFLFFRHMAQKKLTLLLVKKEAPILYPKWFHFEKYVYSYIHIFSFDLWKMNHLFVARNFISLYEDFHWYFSVSWSLLSFLVIILIKVVTYNSWLSTILHVINVEVNWTLKICKWNFECVFPDFTYNIPCPIYFSTHSG